MGYNFNGFRYFLKMVKKMWLIHFLQKTFHARVLKRVESQKLKSDYLD